MSSLRVRLALAFALLAAVVAAFVGVVVYELSTQDLLDRARSKAVANVRSAQAISSAEYASRLLSAMRAPSAARLLTTSWYTPVSWRR